ncbi:hypothetical protein Tco_0110986 [Tanacetum coccineum]
MIRPRSLIERLAMLDVTSESALCSSSNGLALLATKEGSLIGSLSLVCLLGPLERFDVFGLLGIPVSFVPHFSFSTTVRCRNRGPSSKRTPSSVIALASFLGFGMVLLGKRTWELEGLVAIGLKSSKLVAKAC